MFVHLFQQYLASGFGLEGEVERERGRKKESLELLLLNLHCHCRQLGRRFGLNSPLYGDHPAEGCGAFSQLLGGRAPLRVCVGQLTLTSMLMLEPSKTWTWQVIILAIDREASRAHGSEKASETPTIVQPLRFRGNFYVMPPGT